MKPMPGYKVLTFVVVTLAFIAFAERLLIRYIPSGGANRLSGDRVSFLAAGGGQKIDWHGLESDVFTQARGKNKPILLVISLPGCTSAKKMDELVFTDAQVQRLLARNFVCVRVDGVETPDWIAAYLPYSRTNISLVPDYQIWALDPAGKMFDLVGRESLSNVPTAPQFIDQLIKCLDDFNKIQQASFSGDKPPQVPGQLQSQNLALLGINSGAALPNLSGLTASLVSLSGKSIYGGFPLPDGTQLVWPNAYEAVQAIGGKGNARSALDGLLQSPCLDLVDDGFFRGSASINWREPSYEKIAVLNAEMACLLAKMSAQTKDRVYRAISLRTFDMLANDFEVGNDLIANSRVSDQQDVILRSDRSSFSPRRLRELFESEKDRVWVQKNLGLRIEDNSQMTPYCTNLSMLSGDNPKFDEVIKVLRKGGEKPSLDPQVTLDSMGTAVARMEEVARVLRDPDRTAIATGFYDRLNPFFGGQDVLHEIEPTDRASVTLGDYLAFADASLQDYLNTGRINSLRNGFGVLKRSAFLFGGHPGNTYFMSQDSDPFHAALPDSNVAQLTDDFGESCTARAIRLFYCYGQIMRGSPDPDWRATAKDFTTRAFQLAATFTPIVSEMGPDIGGYMYSCALLADSTVALASGPDPVSMASKLSALSPNHLVVPVGAEVWPALLSRETGYWVLRRGNEYGPLTLEQAAKRLGQTLSVP